MTQCSHQEVEAEREVKAKAIKGQIQKLEMVKHLLTEANTLEDIEDDAMDQNSQHLSTVFQKCKHVDVVSDSDGELFNFKDVDEMETTKDEEPVKQNVVSSINLRQKVQLTGLGNMSSLRKRIKQ